MSPKDWSDFLEKYWHKRTSKTGLFFGLVFLFAALFTAFQLVHPLLKDAGVVSGDTASNRFYDTILIVVSLVCGIIYFIVWLSWRQIIFPHDDAIVVIFAPWAETDHHDVVRRLHAQFNVELAARGLGKQIHSKLLPPEDAILNDAGVERIMRERGARLVIFGRVAKGDLKGKKTEGFSEISFSVRHIIAPVDAQLLASSFSIEDFQVLGENSFIDSRFAGSNLSNCACAFIGMGLTAERKYDAAREIWQNLFQKNQSRNNQAINEKQTRFALFISRWFQWNEFCWIVDYYNKNVVDKITSHSVDQDVAVCQSRLNFLIGLNPKFPEYLHCRATLQFHRGETKDALHTLNEIEKLSPNSLHPLFSRPFLTLWQRKYKPALRYFKRLTNLKNPPPAPFILSVISFYESLISQYPDRHELKFGSAIINDLFCDRKIAQENYESFLEAAKNNSAYAPLDAYALERLLALQIKASDTR